LPPPPPPPPKFQFARPRGARRYPTLAALAPDGFNSRARVGRDPDTELGVWRKAFQFARPRGARHARMIV